MEQEKCTSHGVVHCTSKNQINQEQLQEQEHNSRRSADGKLVSCHPLSYVVARF